MIIVSLETDERARWRGALGRTEWAASHKLGPDMQAGRLAAGPRRNRVRILRMQTKAIAQFDLDI